MNETMFRSEIHTYPYKMTLQPQLLKKDQLKLLNKTIMPLLKKQGIELKDVGESFESLLNPLRLEKIKEHRPFYVILKGGSYSKRPSRVLIKNENTKKS
ncbi:MAG TPA: hypothetical protein PL168_10865 [Methanobacterium sp.]|nr:hypothetical protein [Methanobacterium sp.]